MLLRSVLIKPRPTSNWSAVGAAQSHGARRQQWQCRCSARRDGRRRRDEVRVDVVLVHEHADHLIPQPEEEGEPRRQLEVVLREHRPVVRERVHRHVATSIALLAHLVRHPEQEVGKRIARRKSREAYAPFAAPIAALEEPSFA